jgi:hypothetical protein
VSGHRDQNRSGQWRTRPQSGRGRHARRARRGIGVATVAMLAVSTWTAVSGELVDGDAPPRPVDTVPPCAVSVPPAPPASPGTPGTLTGHLRA